MQGFFKKKKKKKKKMGQMQGFLNLLEDLVINLF